MTVLKSLQRLADRTRIFSRSEDGNVAMEMAIATPILLLLMMGAWDFGRAMQQTARLESAAAAGALYGSQNSAHSTDTAGISNAARADANDTSNALAVASTAYCSCAGGAQVACTGACASGSPRYYVSVTVNSSFNTLFPYPFVPTIYTLKGNAIMRAQ